MHNWWIAVLQHAGVLTKEEGQHISNEIKTHIHKESYEEATREIEAILAKSDFASGFNKLKKLETKVLALEARLKK